MFSIEALALFIGGVIIAALAFYLGRLLMLIKQRKLAIRTAQISKIKQRNATLGESIYTIAWAMRDGQCELSEGCLRIWVLLGHLVEDYDKATAANTEDQQHSGTDDYQLIYPGIYQLYEKIKDMPTHEARKKYKNNEIMKMDKARWADEVLLKPLIEKDIHQLLIKFADPNKHPGAAAQANKPETESFSQPLAQHKVVKH